jgi:hypothetical protein
MGMSSAPSVTTYDPYQVAQQQAQYNAGAGAVSQQMSEVGQQTPFGSLSYQQTGTYTDPSTGKQMPLTTATTQLSPVEQNLLNTGIGTQQLAAYGGQNLIGQFAGQQSPAVPWTGNVAQMGQGWTGNILAGTNYGAGTTPRIDQSGTNANLGTDYATSIMGAYGGMPIPTAQNTPASAWGTAAQGGLLAGQYGPGTSPQAYGAAPNVAQAGQQLYGAVGQFNPWAAPTAYGTPQIMAGAATGAGQALGQFGGMNAPTAYGAGQGIQGAANFAQGMMGQYGGMANPYISQAAPAAGMAGQQIMNTLAQGGPQDYGALNTVNQTQGQVGGMLAGQYGPGSAPTVAGAGQTANLGQGQVGGLLGQGGYGAGNAPTLGGAAGTANLATNQAAGALANSGYGGAAPNLMNMAGGMTGQMLGQETSYLQPFFTNQTNQLDTQLRNQGLTPETPAYQQAMMNLQQNQNQSVSGFLAQAAPQAFQMAQQQYQLPMQTAQGLAGLGAQEYQAAVGAYQTPEQTAAQIQQGIVSPAYQQAVQGYGLPANIASQLQQGVISPAYATAAQGYQLPSQVASTLAGGVMAPSYQTAAAGYQLPEQMATGAIGGIYNPMLQGQESAYLAPTTAASNIMGGAYSPAMQAAMQGYTAPLGAAGQLQNIYGGMLGSQMAAYGQPASIAEGLQSGMISPALASAAGLYGLPAQTAGAIESGYVQPSFGQAVQGYQLPMQTAESMLSGITAPEYQLQTAGYELPLQAGTSLYQMGAPASIAGNLINTPTANVSPTNLTGAVSTAQQAQNAQAQLAQQQYGSMMSGIGNIGAAGITAFAPMLMSDVRAKENVKRVGTLFDDSPVYSFRYRDDPTMATHVGLMAQEVERKHPEAVHQDRTGYKYVDYAKATAPSSRVADMARALAA